MRRSQQTAIIETIFSTLTRQKLSVSLPYPHGGRVRLTQCMWLAIHNTKDLLNDGGGK